MSSVGFVGLGNMGSALAANLVAAGHDLVTFDLAGAERSPEGATFVPSVAEVARRAAVVVLSLPDGRASEQFVGEIVGVADRVTTHVIDTSTTGPSVSETIGALLAAHGVALIDAPVSGGVAGARARTLTVMVAGADDACAHVEHVLAGLSDRRFRVGGRPGLAQAMKLANNFLSAIALAATSEAVAFGVSAGLDMATMIEVLNASSGHNTATSEKFPNQVLTGRYAAGFANSLMAKDVGLYMRSVGERGTPSTLGAVTASVWDQFVAAEPGADFTRIYPFLTGRDV